MKKHFKELLPKIYIELVIILILLAIAFGQYFLDKIQANAQTKDITITTQVDKVYIDNDTTYIVDKDKHVLCLEFNPEHLLIEDDQYIKVHFSAEYEDSNVIKDCKVDIWGVVPK